MTRCEKWKDRDFLEKARQTCERSPDTYSDIEKVIEFYEVYPEISKLSMWATRPLVRERNKEIQVAAVNAVETEMATRSDIHSPNFSLRHAILSGDQVREILNEQHILVEGTDIEREKLAKEKARKGKEVLYECPLCKGLITVVLSKREKIVSLRVTEEDDDAYNYLAKRFGISKSLLISGILEARQKFPSSFS